MSDHFRPLDVRIEYTDAESCNIYLNGASIGYNVLKGSMKLHSRNADAPRRLCDPLAPQGPLLTLTLIPDHLDISSQYREEVAE
nr:MAG TPA_asm: hypothetical protein [Caudoviricetes sp.]